MPNVGIWTDFKKQTIINAPFIEPGYLTAAFILQIRKKNPDIVPPGIDSGGTHVRVSSGCQKAKIGVNVPDSESHGAPELCVLASVS